MNRLLSKKFRFYSFVCISLLVFVHGYNLKDGYLLPFSLVDEPLTFTTFIEYFFSNGLLRFRIPLLFMISGYIFAIQDNKPYWVMVKKRFTTLIIPFFIWSGIGLLITYLWQQHPITARAVQDSLMDQLGDNRPYKEIGWKGILYRWFVVPTSFQLWFIRSLFIYNVLYPVFKWAVIKVPLIWFCITFLLWISVFNAYLFEGSGLFFFSVGIWLNKSSYPIDKKPDWFSSYLAWLFFIGLAIIRTFMAFELENNLTSFWVLTILFAGTVISGLIAVWFGADVVMNWCMERKWFVWLTAFSFIIYGLHVPLIEYITMLMFRYMNAMPNYRLLIYILAPAIVLTICVVTGTVLRKVVPRFYRLATGGRGF